MVIPSTEEQSANWYIRPVHPGEVEVLRAFAEQTFRKAWQENNAPDAFEDYCKQAFSTEKLLAEMHAPGAEFYFAWDRDFLAAYLKLNIDRKPDDWDAGKALQLERIYVSPEIQSRGLGAWLLQFTEERARETAAAWVWLSVWKKAPRSIAFYQRNGYDIFGVDTFWLGDDPQEDWLMRKRITK